MSITALTVARQAVRMDFASIRHRCLSGRHFTRAADVQAAWFDAVALVDTEQFFFIDDDDALPDDYADVLARCIDTGVAVAYTAESVNGRRRESAPYTQVAHLANPLLMHHLVLCDTALAREVIADLPRGHYWPEMQLYWEMAKRGGAAYVPEVGYLWNKGDAGLHREWFTVLGIANSRAWCMENR